MSIICLELILKKNTLVSWTPALIHGLFKSPNWLYVYPRYRHNTANFQEGQTPLHWETCQAACGQTSLYTLNVTVRHEYIKMENNIFNSWNLACTYRKDVVNPFIIFYCMGRLAAWTGWSLLSAPFYCSNVALREILPFYDIRTVSVLSCLFSHDLLLNTWQKAIMQRSTNFSSTLL